MDTDKSDTMTNLPIQRDPAAYSRHPSRREFLGIAAATATAVALGKAGLILAAKRDKSLVAGLAGPRGKTGVTFFVTADTHFGADKTIARLNKQQIAAMNILPGKFYPRGIGGQVKTPRGVLVAGDLTDHGSMAEWKQFETYYGSNGKDGLLKYPCYAGAGNHDRNIRVPLFRPVYRGIEERHGRQTYSWDWDNVHFVCLGIYPDRATLQWLQRDLAKVGKTRPVVLFLHYPFVGPFSDWWWWTKNEKISLIRTIAGYNVVGVFHGHFHGSAHYKYRGCDVYNVGSPRWIYNNFAAVNINDTTMSVAYWDWAKNRWGWSHSKKLHATRPD